MITVRFPTGVAVQFNDANFAARNAGGFTDLYDRKDGRWIAQVPTAGCIVEIGKPCRVYNSNHQPEELVDALNRALADPAQRDRLPMDGLAEVKRRLRSLDIKRWRWLR